MLLTVQAKRYRALILKNYMLELEPELRSKDHDY